jgi:hypothetical protein
MSILRIDCCVCGCDMGTKDGEGQTGITSGICSIECGLATLPDYLHEAYLKMMAAPEAA